MEPTAVVTTPGTTTPAAPAAPATSAPAASPTPSQRPTFAQAFASDVTPPDSSVAAPLETAATEQAETTEATGAIHPSATKPQGPIPFDVHKTALDNARTKAKDEALTEWRATHGWAEQVPQATFEKFAETATQMSRDPIAFLDGFVKELRADPIHGPLLKSYAGRMLAGARGQAAPSLEPDVQIIGPDGSVTGSTFSGDRVKAIVQHAVNEAVAQKVGPLEAESAKRQADTKQAETARLIDTRADAEIADILDGLDLPPEAAQKGDPLLEAFSTAMAEHPEWSTAKLVSHVRKTHVAPSAAAKAKQAALDDLTHRAAASQMNPATAAIPTTHRPKSFLDPSLKW